MELTEVHSSMEIDEVNQNGGKFKEINYYKCYTNTNRTEDKLNTISVYYEDENITVNYLHANKINVELGQYVELGQQLGEQGYAGLTLLIDHMFILKLRKEEFLGFQIQLMI